jgi:hypothetical protein
MCKVEYRGAVLGGQKKHEFCSIPSTSRRSLCAVTIGEWSARGLNMMCGCKSVKLWEGEMCRIEVKSANAC